jgi:hypothetical protein
VCAACMHPSHTGRECSHNDLHRLYVCPHCPAEHTRAPELLIRECAGKNTSKPWASHLWQRSNPNQSSIHPQARPYHRPYSIHSRNQSSDQRAWWMQNVRLNDENRCLDINQYAHIDVYTYVPPPNKANTSCSVTWVTTASSNLFHLSPPRADFAKPT